MDKNYKNITTNVRGASAMDHHVTYDEELGEENVELVDSEWADFERALRYFVILLINLLTGPFNFLAPLPFFKCFIFLE